MESTSLSGAITHQSGGLATPPESEVELVEEHIEKSSSLSMIPAVPANQARGLSRRNRGVFFTTRKTANRPGFHRRTHLDHENATPQCPAISTVQTGGLRGDPFNSFPVENKDIVPEAVDFLLIDIASVAVPGLIQRNAFNPKVAAFMQASMRHKLVFHAVIAFAQGYREVANTGATEPSSAVLYHRWKATQGLHERLRNPETQADDISILTTFLLTDNVWRYGEEAIGKAHYAGMMRMIALRGGLDKLGLNGVLKSIIEFGNSTDLGDSFRPRTNVPLADMTYPTHPFSPEICANISKIPSGYTEIALGGYLSLETMATITSLQEWIGTDPLIRDPAPSKQILSARRCMSAAISRNDGRAEECVCLGIVITSMRLFHARFSRMDRPFLDRILDIARALHRLGPNKNRVEMAECEHMAYVTMVAVEACDLCIELQGHVRALVDLLVEMESFARCWSTLEPVLQKFFWVPLAIDKWRACWIRHMRRREERAFTTSPPETIAG